MSPFSPRLHARRVAGGDRHHRRPDRASAARDPESGAAARAQCENNFKQIALATHTYENVLSTIPRGYIPNGGSFLYLLLPYIEQQAVVNQGNYYGGGNVIKTFVCPSDPSDPSGHGADSFYGYGPQANYATGNYRGNMMVYDPLADRSILLAMPDGSSNTIMVCHFLQVCDGNAPFSFEQGGLVVTEWVADTGNKNFGPHSIPVFGWTNYTTINNVTLPGGTIVPNFLNDASQSFQAMPSPIMPPGNCVIGPVTPHSAMIVALGDGESVRAMDPSISTTTWVNACTPSDGNPLGSDW